MDHEKLSHRSFWRCPINATHECDSQEALEQHLRSDHGDEFEEPQINAIAQCTRQGRAEDRTSCPMCFAKVDVEMVEHIAQHLEQLACLVLPEFMFQALARTANLKEAKSSNAVSTPGSSGEPGLTGLTTPNTTEVGPIRESDVSLNPTARPWVPSDPETKYPVQRYNPDQIAAVGNVPTETTEVVRTGTYLTEATRYSRLDGGREPSVTTPTFRTVGRKAGVPSSLPTLKARASDIALVPTWDTTRQQVPEWEALDVSYKVRKKPGNFFKLGRVFSTLWTEPAPSGIGSSTVSDQNVTFSRFNEPIFTKVRRFVVVREGTGHCTVVPIVTYAGRGVAKQGVRKSDHVIIYTGKEPSTAKPAEAPSPGELPMRAPSIRVDADSRIAYLDSMSRINYSKVYTIEHNVKVEVIGLVNEQSVGYLQTQFLAVWTSNEETQRARNTQTAVPGPSFRLFGTFSGPPPRAHAISRTGSNESLRSERSSTTMATSMSGLSRRMAGAGKVKDDDGSNEDDDEYEDWDWYYER